jgi:hypothetical protein
MEKVVPYFKYFTTIFYLEFFEHNLETAMFTAARGNSPAATLPQSTHAALFQPDYPLA